MKIAIMQPYLFPYIGYFQLIHSVEKFVVYDDIEYTKKGWINRNRIFLNNSEFLFSIPLKKNSDYLDIGQRYLADNYDEYKKKFKGQLTSAYSKSPEFKNAFPIIESCLDYTDKNLFSFLYHSIRQVCDYLGINTQFAISSSLLIDPGLKGEQKVIAICEKMGATVYINAIRGRELYSSQNFSKKNISLKFIQSGTINYQQFSGNFVSNLSIIDLMMFNRPEVVSGFLNDYSLI